MPTLTIRPQINSLTLYLRKWEKRQKKEDKVSKGKKQYIIEQRPHKNHIRERIVSSMNAVRKTGSDSFVLYSHTKQKLDPTNTIHKNELKNVLKINYRSLIPKTPIRQSRKKVA